MLCDASVPHFFVCIFGDTSSQFDSSQALRFRVSSYAGLDQKTVMHVGVVLFFACRLLGRPCGAGAEFRRPAELCGTLSCQSSPFSLSGPTIGPLIPLSPHSATAVYQILLFSKLGQKVCERVGFRFDSDWKGLRHHLVREARQCSGRQWRRLSSAEFGTLSARDLVQTENKQSEVSVSDARRVRDCESGAW